MVMAAVQESGADFTDIPRLYRLAAQRAVSVPDGDTVEDNNVLHLDALLVDNEAVLLPRYLV